MGSQEATCLVTIMDRRSRDLVLPHGDGEMRGGGWEIRHFYLQKAGDMGGMGKAKDAPLLGAVERWRYWCAAAGEDLAQGREGRGCSSASAWMVGCAWRGAAAGGVTLGSRRETESDCTALHAASGCTLGYFWRTPRLLGTKQQLTTMGPPFSRHGNMNSCSPLPPSSLSLKNPHH